MILRSYLYCTPTKRSVPHERQLDYSSSAYQNLTYCNRVAHVRVEPYGNSVPMNSLSPGGESFWSVFSICFYVATNKFEIVFGRLSCHLVLDGKLNNKRTAVYDPTSWLGV